MLAVFASAATVSAATRIDYYNNGEIDSTVEINDTTTNGPELADSDSYGFSIVNIGDLNGDGVDDLAVGAYTDDTGGTNRGAVHINFMNSDGSVDSTVEINDTTKEKIRVLVSSLEEYEDVQKITTNIS